MDREDRVRRYNLKSVRKSMYSPTEIDSESAEPGTEMTPQQLNARRIRVVDRFAIILQIFAAGAKNRIAQL
jgi:hypothetical protein